MKSASKPKNESARLEALNKYQLLDTISEEVYDDITKIATEMCGTPVALLSLVDADRQWNKSVQGTKLKEFEREHSFCAHAILEPDELFVVPDARYDERFHDNPLVTGEHQIVFYAGMPLKDAEGNPIGALCVIDSRPRTLPEEKLVSLKSLAKLVQAHFELRLANMRLEESRDRLMLATPLVDTVLNGLELLQESQLTPAQTDQLEILKDTTIALKSLFEDPEPTEA